MKVKAEARILFSPTSLHDPPQRFPPQAWPTDKREAEERMRPLLETLNNFNLTDYKFWLEIASVLFVATVGRDTFFQQWVGSSH